MYTFLCDFEAQRSIVNEDFVSHFGPHNKSLDDKNFFLCAKLFKGLVRSHCQFITFLQLHWDLNIL